MLEITSLIVTHNVLRHAGSISEMADYVGRGGVYDQNMLKNFSAFNGLDRVSPLIQLVKFEDGLIYIHDGHHRVVSCFLSGRMYLYKDEYILSNWKYEQYMKPNHLGGWYTPFDPRIQVRTADFNNFKHEAKRRFESGLSPEEVVNWIQMNHHLYRQDRLISSISELVKSIRAAA